MAAIGLALANVALGLGNIGAGIGFGVAEQDKMDELDKKAKTLRQDVTTASNMYDHIYYMVAVNLDRVKKALDKLPSDFLDKVEKQITNDISTSNAESAIQTMAKVLGYVGDAAGLGAGVLQVVRYLRVRKAQGDKPAEDPVQDPFEYVPLDGETPPAVVEPESSFTETPRLTKAINGLNIAGIVFGIAGLATTIGLGVWTLEKLDKALDDVANKQKQVTQFQTAMQTALDQIVTDAGLPAKSYSELTTMAATWENISANLDSYQKALDYAIKGYVLNKTLDQIKARVTAVSDSGTPFPEDGYTLAKTLADDINYLFSQNKTDKEIVAYFATDNPKIGLRFVFTEYFISSLRPW